MQSLPMPTLLKVIAGEVITWWDLSPQQSVQTNPKNSHGLWRRHTIHAAKFEWNTTWLHRQQDTVCKAMYAIFHSNFAAYIVCRRYKACEFLGFVCNDCWGNKSNHIITFPANKNLNFLLGDDVIFVQCPFKTTSFFFCFGLSLVLLDFLKQLSHLAIFLPCSSQHMYHLL